MLAKLSTTINNLVELRKENKNTSTLLTELNDLAFILDKDDNKINILRALYKKKNPNNKAFFDYYYLKLLQLLSFSYTNIESLLKEDFSLDLKKYLFNLLKNDEKISFLIQNKINIDLINAEIKAGNKRVLRFLLSNLEIIEKIDDNSLIIPINIFKKYIDITKLSVPLILKITNDSLTNYLNYKFPDIYDLVNLLDKNKSLIKYIPNQSLTVNIENKESLISLLKKEVNILPKLDGSIIIKYLNFGDLDNLTHYDNINNQTMFFISELKVIFNKSHNYDYLYFINNSDDHSLIIYPFYAEKYEQFAKIIRNYDCLKKFSYEIMETVINTTIYMTRR